MVGGHGNRDYGGNYAATDECRYCHKLGHWTRERLRKVREEAHLVQENASGPGFLMVVVEENAVMATNLAATTAKLGARHPYRP